MKVVFFDPQTVRHPVWLFLAMSLPLVGRIVLKMVLPAILAAILVIAFTHRTTIFAGATGGGLVLLGVVLTGIIGTIHELAHIFAGARLVGPAYPRALVIPTFGHPFVRFDSRQIKVSPSHVALILLTGSLSGLFVSTLVLIAVLITPDPWGVRWMWLAYWGAFTFPQIASLIPIGETDGHKVKQLMHEKSVTWSDIRKAARQLFST